MMLQRNITRVFLFTILVISCLVITGANAQIVKTVAGGAFRNGAAGTYTALTHPFFAAYDAKGNLYVPDELNHRVTKLNSKGVISTVAGTGISGYSGDDGTAKGTLVSYPTGIAIRAGDIFFADSGNYRIRKINTVGVITTIAGNGTIGYSGDGGTATAASIGQIFGITFDSSGNLFLADVTNNVVRMVDTSGLIHTVAGNGTAGFSGDGGPATSATLNFPFSVVTDGSKNLYIADNKNYRVRRVDAAGTITTFAGNGSAGCTGDGGPATSATLGTARGLMIASGNLFISTGSCGRIREVNLSTNIIATFAGSSSGYNGDGHAPLTTKFLGPVGLVISPLGNLVVVDTNNQRVREVNQIVQVVSTIAGGYNGDGGAGTSSSLDLPEAIAFDNAGNLYIADANANRVRKLSPTGVITTFAGTGLNGNSGDGGPAVSAALQTPNAVTADANGNVFIADLYGYEIRKVDSAGIITTFALSYNFGGDAPFDIVGGLAADSQGNIYATDYYGGVVWKITTGGTGSIVAGVQYMYGYNGDGIPATQAYLNFDLYSGVAVDSHGNVYIGDTYNNLVRKVDAKTGLISTIAGTVGNTGCGFGGDGGLATAALLCTPEGVAVDKKGNVFIADMYNVRIRSLNSAGIIDTLAGTGIQGYNGNRLPARQTNLDIPAVVAVNPSGVVFEADMLQYRVRKIH